MTDKDEIERLKKQFEEVEENNYLYFNALMLLANDYYKNLLCNNGGDVNFDIKETLKIVLKYTRKAKELSE